MLFVILSGLIFEFTALDSAMILLVDLSGFIFEKLICIY